MVEVKKCLQDLRGMKNKMVTVNDTISIIQSKPEYVFGSLIVHSMDDSGVVYKWLEEIGGVAERKKMFIQLSIEDKDLALESRTAVKSVEIEPAGD